MQSRGMDAVAVGFINAHIAAITRLISPQLRFRVYLG